MRRNLVPLGLYTEPYLPAHVVACLWKKNKTFNAEPSDGYDFVRSTA